MTKEECQSISVKEPQERNRTERRMYKKAVQRGYIVEEYFWTEKALNSVQMTLAITIAKTMEKGNKHYVHPAPKTMVKLQQDYYNKNISLPTYWRNMKCLNDMGFIGRRNRYKKNDQNQPHRLPSLITLTLKGARYLAKLGISYARKIVESMMQWLNKNDKRFPTIREINPNKSNDYEKELEEIRDRAIKPCIV